METAPAKAAFLTRETYEALVVTTMSTVLCTRHLLNRGFRYVLTFKYSSDHVESLFSAVRQLNGFNDQTDAYGALSSLHKILVTGIVKPSTHANSRDSQFDMSALLQKPEAQQDLHSPTIDGALQPFHQTLRTLPGSTLTFMKVIVMLLV